MYKAKTEVTNYELHDKPFVEVKLENGDANEYMVVRITTDSLFITAFIEGVKSDSVQMPLQLIHGAVQELKKIIVGDIIDGAK